MSSEELEELERFFKLAAILLSSALLLLKWLAAPDLPLSVAFAPFWVPAAEIVLALLICSVELWLERRRNRRGR